MDIRGIMEKNKIDSTAYKSIQLFGLLCLMVLQITKIDCSMVVAKNANVNNPAIYVTHFLNNFDAKDFDFNRFGIVGEDDFNRLGLESRQSIYKPSTSGSSSKSKTKLKSDEEMRAYLENRENEKNKLLADPKTKFVVIDGKMHLDRENQYANNKLIDFEFKIEDLLQETEEDVDGKSMFFYNTSLTEKQIDDLLALREELGSRSTRFSKSMNVVFPIEIVGKDLIEQLDTIEDSIKKSQESYSYDI